MKLITDTFDLEAKFDVGTNTVGGNNSFAVGGSNNVAAATSMAVGYSNGITGGTNNTALGVVHGITGGDANTAVGNNNYITGGNNGFFAGSDHFGDQAKNNIVAFGKSARPYNHYEFAQSSGAFAVAGDAQTSVLVLRKQTTNENQTELALDGLSDYIDTKDNKSYFLKCFVVARQSGAIDSAVFDKGFVIRRASGFATCTSQENSGNSAETIDAALSGIAFTVSVDTATDGHIKLQVTGLAATTINWVARVEMVEVGV